ncbi:MAG: SAM-dependent methyltransferase, partial [Inquilinus sp.]|nr:SAM-dependent methyltransferase [Inquilinus sp.]
AQAILASLALIVLPLVWLRRRPAARRGLSMGRVAVYFLALGFAFLFVEIAFIQRLTLFLGHPLGAVTVVLFGFLVFAGLGAGVSARLGDGWPRLALAAAVAAILAVAIAYQLAMPTLLPVLLALPLAPKVAITLALIAPLAFAMGMPFPLGLTAVSRLAPALVPWAWGINGCASVIAAALASLLAMHLGFNAVILLALALYAAAAAVFAAPVGEAWARGAQGA